MFAVERGKKLNMKNVYTRKSQTPKDEQIKKGLFIIIN